MNPQGVASVWLQGLSFFDGCAGDGTELANKAAVAGKWSPPRITSADLEYSVACSSAELRYCAVDRKPVSMLV